MCLGNPVNPIDKVRNAPPIKMNAIIQEVLVAPIKLSKNVFHVSDPCNVANTKPPITPKAAASVGVAQPIYIDPITNIIKENIGIKNFELFNFTKKLISGSLFGIFFLLNNDQIAT